MKRIIYLALIFTFFTCRGLVAQEEVLMDMQMNPVVAKRWHQLQLNYSSAKLAQQIIDTLVLPFLDDFSKESIFPDTAKWVGSSVFINRTYPKAPVSIGVATFDGVDSTGYPYNFTASGTSSGEADHLTSLPIDLGSFFPVDSVYFSFFYQAQGRGNAPETKDSLVLQYKRPSTGIWENVWSHKGYTPSNNDTNFHLVIVPVIDTAYLRNGFQFRFKNYATLSGNVDHWHIDYVYLNNNRTQTDTIFEDVAFVYEPSSLLKKYQAMPWEQYNTSELKDVVTTLSTVIRNNNNVTKNTFYNYVIKDGSGTVVSSYNGGSTNVNPYSSTGYLNNPPFTSPPLNYTIPALTDSAVYVWESYLKSIPDFDNYNDTIRFYQKFYNYYAYDDGTAEAGYGLSGTNPKMAIRYTLNVADTLRAIQLYFNPIITNVTNFSFRLAVWNNSGGVPGTLIYSDSVVKPVYGQDANQFHTYRLSNPALLLTPGTYFFGWIQNTSDLLNVGFDLNTNSISNTFISVSNVWTPSNFKGSVMLRPVFGEQFSIAGIHGPPTANFDFDVYPNPVQDKLNINLNDRFKYGNIHVSIIDMFGKIVRTENNFTAESIDVSQLAQGLYFLKITGESASSIIKRVAVVR